MVLRRFKLIRDIKSKHGFNFQPLSAYKKRFIEVVILNSHNQGWFYYKKLLKQVWLYYKY